MSLRAYLMGCGAIVVLAGVLCEPVIARENITRVYVRNGCREVLDVDIRYIPVGGSKFISKHYVFSPGEVGYLVDTDNLYVTIAARSRESSRELSKQQVNVGSNPGKYTHTLTCR